MTPFQEFRLWTRRASTGERTTAAVGAVVMLALLAWLMVPVDSSDDDAFEGAVTAGSGDGRAAPTGSGDASGAAQPGASGGAEATASGAGDGGTASGAGSLAGGAATAAGGSSSGSGGGATGSGETAAATTGGGEEGGCTPPPGGDQGVTAGEIKLAITLTNIIGPAGNETFGVPTVDEQRLDFEQVIEALNASGGVACRKLRPTFYSANPADGADLQQKCLDIAGIKPFAVIDAGGYYGQSEANCFPQNKLPFFGTGRITFEQRDQFYPYLFGIGAMDVLYKNMLYALRDRGFFKAENGFRKLGYVYRSCWRSLDRAFPTWLAEVGLKPAQITSISVGCPDSGFANPSVIQQAILKFQQEGVSHVTTYFFFQDFANFTKVAQAQGFKPVYGIADDGVVPITYGNLRPDHDNIANAIAIAADRYGEERSGFTPHEATKKCDAIYTAKNRPPTYQQPVGFGGVACALVWMLAGAIDHAPALQRNALAEGLRLAKSIDLPYPRGPVDYTAPKVTFGGQFWRPLQFQRGCSCWRILDATYKPAYP